MSSPPTKRFHTHRGIAAPPPDRPRHSYEEYWARTVRWRMAAQHAPAFVRSHGAEEARRILNVAVGQPIYSVDDRIIPQLGRHGRYGFILLPGGCYWARKKDVGGQCTFCEFQAIVDEVAGNLPFSNEEFTDLFSAGFATMQNCEMINVFTAGSFLNPGEIPMEVQAGIAREITLSRGSSRILRVESRVQYMLPDTIAPLTAILGRDGKTLDIAIGFETQNDELRNTALRKGMGRRGFIEGIRNAKNAGARVSVYVMLMPWEMTEGFALQECIDSIAFAFECGADEVLLQARYSHFEGVTCPKLWTIAEVLARTAHLGPVMLGRWEMELPEPVVWPKNCPQCTPDMMNVLEEWRDTLDAACVRPDTLPECTCRTAWEEEILDATPPDLVGRRSLPMR